MSLRSTAALLLAAASALASCASPQVYTDRDDAADFGAYATFGFLEPSSVAAAPEGTNPLLPGHLERAAARTLGALGYQPCPEGAQPDMVVSFTLGSRQRVETVESPGFYGRSRYDWGGPYYRETDVRRYTEGTLCVDVFDPARDAPVWHGMTTRTVTQRLRKDPAKAASEVVGAILETFPARPTAGEPATTAGVEG